VKSKEKKQVRKRCRNDDLRGNADDLKTGRPIFNEIGEGKGHRGHITGHRGITRREQRTRKGGKVFVQAEDEDREARKNLEGKKRGRVDGPWKFYSRAGGKRKCRPAPT